MDSIGQVTKWVEHKIGKIINKDLEEKITEENSTFDVETYSNNLLEEYFKEDDIEKVKGILINNSCYNALCTDSENSTEELSTHDSLESESNELQNFSAQEIVKNLESGSKELKKKSLIVLEMYIEDFMNQPSWEKIKDILEKMLNNTDDREMINLILKVFQKPLKCSKKPKIVSKGFTTIVEVTASQIDLFNSENINCHSVEQTYDIKEESLPGKKTAEFAFRNRNRNFFSSEVLIKLMWLMLDSQEQIPVKWVRFNEARFREIIFSFIHLLSSTSTSESKKLSGLELLSVLNPKASWCRYWCHSAVGRSLLCSALRKYKNFFVHIIEIILNHMKINKTNKLPPVKEDLGLNKITSKLTDEISAESTTKKKIIKAGTYKHIKHYPEKITLSKRKKCIGFAPDENGFPSNVKIKMEKKSNSKWIIENIPQCVVAEAVFFHSISLVSCLIQFRSGRALFPVQTATRKRLISAQDLSISIIEYFENVDYNKWGTTEISYTSAYKAQVLVTLDILKQLKAHIHSSRMSAEKQFLYF